MNKTKRVLSVVLAVLMLSSLIAALAIADEMYTVVINYVFEDNSKAAPEWVGTIYKGSAFKKDVKSPEVVGYTPDKPVVSFDIAAADRNVTETVVYKPAVVNYTVKHYQQNVDNDNYVLVETETKTGLTNSLISANLEKKYDGFTALNYNTDVKIAADGSTIVEIKYDRNYYMLSLDLNGGYGVEPIYARYGAAITLGEPTRAGYTFTGWDKSVPTTMPANDVTLTAQWKVDDRVDYLVQYWLENANDNDYSYDSSVTKTAAPGTTIKRTDVEVSSYTGFQFGSMDTNVTVAADGSSVVNVYYKRNTYTLRFENVRGALNCTKQEHTHSDACCKKGGTSITHWSHSSSCCKLGLSSHTHNDNCYYDYVEFTNIKYGADTSPWWNQAPSGYLWYTTKSGDTFYTAAPDMPNNNLTIYGKTSSGTSTIHYYEKGTTTSIRPDLTVRESGWTFTDEDYIKIPGFTYSSNSKKDNDYYLYYTRNSYKLDFNSANKIVKSETIPYEKALSGYNFTPDYPAKLEAGAYKFDGWYTDPGCTNAVDWETAKMPYKNTVVYAKWAPVVHTVTFAKTEGAEAEETQQVNHNELAQDYTTTNGSYKFIGWFYKDANGVEHAFDLSMPVKHDMNLYAKWRTDVLVNYIIHYQLADGTKVADDTIGSAFVLETKTFEAKVGDALYADYTEGYFPDVPSHSIKMENNQANEFTFVYAPADKVTYTVKYLEKGTNTQLHTPKTVETTKAVVTEIFEPVKGYAVDEYQKRLILTAGEGAATNEITFWYTKDEIHAPVTIIHWTQNIEGEGYTQYQTSTEQGTIGNDYKAEWTTIEGFHRNEGKSNVEGNLKDYTGLVLNLYYDRDMITYTFHFVDSVTGEQIANDIQGEARYGKTVSQEALQIDGYKLAEGTPELKAITVGTVSAANEFTFYYIGYFNVVHVKDGGMNKITTEVDYTRSVIDNGYNLTAAVTPGYLYGGAFDDEKCETVYNFGQENAINFTPVKGETYYIWEVDKKYLAPKTYTFARPDQSDPNKTRQVTDLFLMTTVDRGLYQEVGFGIGSRNFASNPGVYSKVSVVYVGSKKLKEELYVASGLLKVTAEGEKAPNDRDIGYIGAYKLTDEQFTTFKTTPFTFVPYWVTLDGIRVTGINERQCTYTAGIETIGVQNTEKGSQIGLNRTTATQTVATVETYMVSRPEDAVVDVPVTPDVPETPEIPEVPEAPDMTLNSGAMYLRAQYTYEMMTNTVKFISAIDVNECTEYGFVINGKVVKCEEAAETVDGYDANYLFGGSVNGAMLMSCNMLLDGLVDGMTINVTPYYVALDGTTVVYGETRTLVYRQWVGLEG